MQNINAAEWMLVLLCLPGKLPQPAGILLLDLNADRLAVKLKTDIVVDDESLAAFWGGLELFLKAEAAEKGGQQVVAWLERASHFVQLSDRNRIELTSGTHLEALENLYRKAVAASD